MANASWKKFRKNKIKEGMKTINASKVTAEALFGQMTEEELEKFAEELAKELGVKEEEQGWLYPYQSERSETSHRA